MPGQRARFRRKPEIGFHTQQALGTRKEREGEEGGEEGNSLAFGYDT